MYGMPNEIHVQADGALRIITLNRPDALNAVNDPLHCGLARLWDELSEDQSARAAVLTGAGRAFSAGGDFNYLDEIRRDDSFQSLRSVIIIVTDISFNRFIALSCVVVSRQRPVFSIFAWSQNPCRCRRIRARNASFVKLLF